MIADPGKPILAPVIGPRADLIMREVVPGIPILTVVLANPPPIDAH